MSVWEDITSQSDNLKRVVSVHAQKPHPALEQAVSLLRGVDRIVFTGVGSGLNATIPAAYYLMEKGFPAQHLDTTEAIYGMLPGLRGAGLVLNTRSGETAELIKLAQLARQSGIPSVAVTNEPASSVAKLADAIYRPAPAGTSWLCYQHTAVCWQPSWYWLRAWWMSWRRCWRGWSAPLKMCRVCLIR